MKQLSPQMSAERVGVGEGDLRNGTMSAAPVGFFTSRTKSGIDGEMAEWLKAHAWKACILQKGIEGSNPSLSASLKFRIFRRQIPFLNPLCRIDIARPCL
jgi:hypothetical protein